MTPQLATSAGLGPLPFPDPLTRARPARASSALVLLSAAQFLVLLSASIVNVALPSVRSGLQLTPAALTWVVNAYVVAFGALLLTGGRVADVRGQRRTFRAGLALFTAATLVAGLAPNATVLLAARALQGAGAALLSPAALALLLRLHPEPRQRAGALAVWGGVSAAGGAAGVLLGGVLTAWLGWRWIFLAAVPLGLATLAPSAALLPADPARTRRALDLPGAGLVAATLVLLTYAVVHGGSTGWTTPATLGSAAAGAALLLVTVAVERREPDPLLPLGLLADRPVLRANTAMALLGATWVGLFVLLALYQQQVLGWSPLRSAVTQLPLALANAVAAAATAPAARRLGARATTSGALLLLAAGLAWLGAAAQTGGTFLRSLLGPTVLIGLGIGAAFVQLTSAATITVRPHETGVAGGLINTTRQIGGALGLAGALAIAAARTSSVDVVPHTAALAAGYRAGLLTLAAAAALAAAVTGTAHRPTPSS
ncbi:MFS transporter [Motilibacter aurantiacus]|uniref:MFS transporter n=1 Tax=Motilibacter aurantiacus TaxID=2714955 RepID=UPI001408BB04|nr:MFS transporter [Motilibacter aurantiacus]NHC45334.1 MFS transporter [Motilibacter aurantiacus]